MPQVPDGPPALVQAAKPPASEQTLGKPMSWSVLAAITYRPPEPFISLYLFI